MNIKVRTQDGKPLRIIANPDIAAGMAAIERAWVHLREAEQHIREADEKLNREGK